MNQTTFTLDEVLDLIRDGVAQAGSKAFYAGLVGISPSELSDILHGRRKPSKKLLAYLDLKAETIYHPRPETENRA